MGQYRPATLAERVDVRIAVRTSITREAIRGGPEELGRRMREAATSVLGPCSFELVEPSSTKVRVRTLQPLDGEYVEFIYDFATIL